MKEVQAEGGRRVYEYLGSDGVTYYSFTRKEGTVSTSLQLRLQSKLGTNLVNFLVELKRLGRYLDLLDRKDAG